MSTTPQIQALFQDIADAILSVCDAACVTVVVAGQSSPVRCACDPEVGQVLAALPVVHDALADGQPRTEAPPSDDRLKDAVLIGVEPMSIGRDGLHGALVFALRDSSQVDQSIALAHALASETNNEVALMRMAPFLSTALEAVENGVTIADAHLEDSPLVYVNDAFVQMTGYTRAETLGRNCRFLQGHLRDQPGLQTIRNAMARGVDCTTVLTNVRRNGEAFKNRLRLRPIRTSDGTISHIVGIQTDVTSEQAALESLDLQKRRYESLVKSVASFTWHMNSDGEVQGLDPSWCVLAGLSPSSETSDAATIRNALGPETAQTFRHQWWQALEKLEPFDVVYPLPPGGSSPRWFQDRITPVLNDEGRLLEWFGVSQEVTALKRAEQDLQRVIQAAPIGMLVIDQEGTITMANVEASRLFGYSVAKLTGMSIECLVPDSARRSHAKLRSDFFAAPASRQMGRDRVVRGLRKDGTEFDAEIGLSWFGQDQERRVIASVNDTTELNRARQAAEQAAYHDRLTGLLSREGFVRRLDESSFRNTLHPGSSLVAIDISGLREINTAQGYEAGDQVLKETARRLTSETGGVNQVARSGSGAFLVVASVDRRRTPKWWRQRLSAVFEVPFEINGFVLFISVAFGYVRIGKKMARDAATLINDAELALRQSQNTVSVTWTQYTQHLEHRARTVVATTRRLRKALRHDDLKLYYQPKVDLSTGHPVSTEALVRWQDPDRGLIAPSEFIPLAEGSQLIGPIGEWVLRRACRDLRVWQDAGLDVLPVSVNVSLVQFQLGSVPDIVQNALTEFAIEPHQLYLEITESVFEDHGESLKADLLALSAMGVKLSLDDFGTGYSSLAHLHDYPFDEIKIDKSFVWRLDAGKYGQAICKAVHLLAEAIGAQFVAEGVESAHHVNILKSLGCTVGQGFYYHRPMPEPEWQQQLRELQYACSNPDIS